ncbi:DUF4375 domain-containing protein [Pseudomonas sp. PS01300]|uniref:DMP19 family protein n=1 Tax=Pseudomonas sp. PS01300 TaxID=2991436 RepID=UPI00249A69D0|nr:DUF4375 domain-containing protein [Pseudomonas sp. PS01300]
MSITNSPTWAQLEARWGHGFDTLLAQEQEAIALWWLEAETMNGRLDQYFWNSAGDQALIALRGLHALHMPVTAKAFGDALVLFGPHYPERRDARMEVLEALEAAHGEDLFEAPSRLIQNLPEDFVQAALDRLTELYRHL